HCRAVHARPGHNDGHIPGSAPEFPACRPLLEHIRIAAQQHGQVSKLGARRRGTHKDGSALRRARSPCHALFATGNVISVSATPNNGQLKRSGNMVRSASVPLSAVRMASVMNTNTARTPPTPPRAMDFQPGDAGEHSNCVVKVPHKIIRSAMVVG